MVSSARTDEVLKVIVANPSWMCQMCSRRPSSSKRTARDFRKAAGGDTHCSTTKPHPTSSPPIPVPQIADTRAMWPLRRRTTSSTRTRSVEPGVLPHEVSGLHRAAIAIFDLTRAFVAKPHMSVFGGHAHIAAHVGMSALCPKSAHSSHTGNSSAGNRVWITCHF